jgi:hypothetical protein
LTYFLRNKLQVAWLWFDLVFATPIGLFRKVVGFFVGYAFVIVVAFTAGLGACASTPTIDQTVADLRNRISLTVDNQSWSQVGVYLMSEGQPHRVATVEGLTTQRTTIRRSALRGDAMRVLIRPLAGRAYLVDPVFVDSDIYRVTLEVHDNGRLSNLWPGK